MCSGMALLVDKILKASLPSYDLSIGGVVFNNSNITDQDSTFLISRIKLKHYYSDQKKINTVWCISVD
jgi:hypothetical protein